jgi:hypothetical protein
MHKIQQERHCRAHLTSRAHASRSELPEDYEFLGRLEGFLGRPIRRLNPDRDFDFWLREYRHFLPSPKTRWCTRQLKLRPFERWIKDDLDLGNRVISYVAIRANEPYCSGHIATHPKRWTAPRYGGPRPSPWPRSPEEW